MDNIVYGVPLPPRVKTAQPIEDFKLLLTFDNGERRIFDAKPLLKFKVFQPLQNEQFFKSVKVAYGSILWADDIDYCPDTLYMESVAV